MIMEMSAAPFVKDLGCTASPSLGCGCCKPGWAAPVSAWLWQAVVRKCCRATGMPVGVQDMLSLLHEGDGGDMSGG